MQVRYAQQHYTDLAEPSTPFTNIDNGPPLHDLAVALEDQDLSWESAVFHYYNSSLPIPTPNFLHPEPYNQPTDDILPNSDNDTYPGDGGESELFPVDSSLLGNLPLIDNEPSLPTVLRKRQWDDDSEEAAPNFDYRPSGAVAALAASTYALSVLDLERRKKRRKVQQTSDAYIPPSPYSAPENCPGRHSLPIQESEIGSTSLQHIIAEVRAIYEGLLTVEQRCLSTEDSSVHSTGPLQMKTSELLTLASGCKLLMESASGCGQSETHWRKCLQEILRLQSAIDNKSLADTALRSSNSFEPLTTDAASKRSEDELAIPYHPLVQQFFDRYDDYDLLQEELDHHLERKASLEDKKEARLCLHITMDLDDEAWLAGYQDRCDDLCSQIDEILTELEGMKAECMAQGLMNEGGEPISFDSLDEGFRREAEEEEKEEVWTEQSPADITKFSNLSTQIELESPEDWLASFLELEIWPTDDDPSWQQKHTTISKAAHDSPSGLFGMVPTLVCATASISFTTSAHIELEDMLGSAEEPQTNQSNHSDGQEPNPNNPPDDSTPDHKDPVVRTKKHICPHCQKAHARPSELKFVSFSFFLSLPSTSSHHTANPARKHLKCHNKNIFCLMPNCTFACTRDRDLQRHEKTVHRDVFGGEDHVCPYEECVMLGVKYPRRDHLLRHLRGKHGTSEKDHGNSGEEGS